MRLTGQHKEGPGRICFGVFLTVLVLIGACFAGSPTAAQSQQTGLVFEIDGPIGPATSDYIRRGLGKAARDGAYLIVLRIDTPGGLDTSMREIIRDILASPLPVITYVHPSGARAASAGTYILYASHIAAMSPGTNLGAATPIAIGGGGLPLSDPDSAGRGDENGAGEADSRQDAIGLQGDPRHSKALNDAVAYIRSLAELRDRNAEWAEKAVREAASLSATEALQLGVIDIVAKNLDDLLRQANGRTVLLGERELILDTDKIHLRQVEPDWRTKLLSAIANPNVALILMMIGVYGLIFEFSNPGALYPGTIGAICLLLGLYALAAMPVNSAGIALIILGIGLSIGEAFVPSFGVLGIGGVISLVLGMMILIDADVPGFELAWPVIAGVAFATVAFCLLVVRMAIGSFRRKVTSGREEMLGATGEVQDWDGNRGHVFVHSERWRAKSDYGLKERQSIRVTSVDGLTLTVEPENQES